MSLQPWSHWIDVDRIRALHAEGMERYGGLPSVGDVPCIESALGTAYNAEMYSMPEVDDETIVSGLPFCVYLLFYIATKQCWSDGSKRTAWASAMWVLATMGLTIDATDEEAYEFCISVADKTVTKGEDVVSWIAEHLIELDPTLS